MSDISRLTGVGAKREKLLAEAGIRTLRDLIYHLPRRYIDRTRFTPIADLRVGADCIFPATVISLAVVHTRMTVEVEDGSGSVELVFFNGVKYLRGRFHEGQRILVAGVPTYFRDLQLTHPECEPFDDGREYRGEILPRYPLTEAMAEGRVEHRLLQRLALEALEKFSFTDGAEPGDREALGLLPETELLRGLHRPEAMDAIEGLRRQLKLRELLPLSLRLATLRRSRKASGRAWPRSEKLSAALRAALPFSLTPGQIEAVEAVSAGQAAAGQFLGLLQGDVGAGKTVVALLTAANVLDAGGQVALMAPTEILAQQHHRTVSPWLASAGISCALLTGDTSPLERQALQEALETGELRFLVGTHALYSAGLGFRNLGYAIVDEQHRFGVRQRQALAEKGERPDVLYLSATPIPRTLAQTAYGDLESVVLRDKPAGRLPVKTRLVPRTKRRDMLAFLLKETQGGNQAFWVVPQIGKGDPGVKGRRDDPDIVERSAPSPEDDLATLEKIRIELVAYRADWKIGVVHGRLSAEAKDAALRAFRSGETQLLVATTVIEVGVDIPQANLMVIEGPDRFGLAQLHQLRGRTGRGAEQAWCFLAAPERPWPPETQERLAAFAETTDGFRIAEMDLRSRGAGDFEGADQSGYGALRFTDWVDDFELVAEMRRYAEARISGADPAAKPGIP